MKRLILIIYLMIGLGHNYTSADEQIQYFAYRYINPEGQTDIRWINLQEPNSIYSLSMANYTLNATALSPVGATLAYIAKSDEIPDKAVLYILDLVTEEVQALPIQPALLRAEQTPLYDLQWVNSQSLRWSPDGTQLAFLGVTGSERFDVYIYNLDLGTQVNVTENIPISRNRIAVSNWSPDGQWLAINAYLEVNGEVFLHETLLASSDGTQTHRILPETQTCHIAWSQDMLYLATTSNCYSLTGGCCLSQVFIYNFEDKNVLPILTAPDNVFVAEANTVYRYDEIYWTHENNLIAVKRTGAVIITTDNPNPVHFSGIVQLDIESATENILVSNTYSAPFVMGSDWQIWGDWVSWNSNSRVQFYNYQTQQVVSNIPECFFSYYAVIDPESEFLGFACNYLDPTEEDEIVIFDLYQSKEIWSYQESIEGFAPIGFTLGTP